MRDWLEEFNDYIREALPLMVFVSWMIMVAIIIKGLMTGEIR